MERSAFQMYHRMCTRGCAPIYGCTRGCAPIYGLSTHIWQINFFDQITFLFTIKMAEFYLFLTAKSLRAKGSKAFHYLWGEIYSIQFQHVACTRGISCWDIVAGDGLKERHAIMESELEGIYCFIFVFRFSHFDLFILTLSCLFYFSRIIVQF